MSPQSLTIRTRTILAALFSASALGAFMLGAGEKPMSNEPTKPVSIGQQAPDFTLTDLDGKSHTLSEYTAKGQTVVLEWFSPMCPFVKKHYRADTGTMLSIQKDMKDQPVVWLRINSARASHPSAELKLNKQAAQKWGITTPILLDPDGHVGLRYGAKHTPEMYVINGNGTLTYHGAIDNRDDAELPGDVNYVRTALSETLAGQAVATPTTKPYGCSIKY